MIMESTSNILKIAEDLAYVRQEYQYKNCYVTIHHGGKEDENIVSIIITAENRRAQKDIGTGK